MKRGAVACAVALVACGAPGPVCPTGHHPDAARTARTLERLRSTPEGEALAALERQLRGVCWGPEALDVITTERLVLLSEALEDGEAAARLGHLLVHVRDGLPLRETIPPGADCEALVAEALDREAVAYAAELRLQHALAAAPRLHAFGLERLVALDPETQRAELRAHLEAHPLGAPGIDALAAGYRERCRRER